MKVFTKTVKYKVFNVVKNNDTKGYNDLCKAAENYSVLEKIRVCYGSLTGFQMQASMYYDEYVEYVANTYGRILPKYFD